MNNNICGLLLDPMNTSSQKPSWQLWLGMCVITVVVAFLWPDVSMKHFAWRSSYSEEWDGHWLIIAVLFLIGVLGCVAMKTSFVDFVLGCALIGFLIGIVVLLAQEYTDAIENGYGYNVVERVKSRLLTHIKFKSFMSQQGIWFEGLYSSAVAVASGAVLLAISRFYMKKTKIDSKGDS